MGIDPVTHKPKNDALLSSNGQTKSAAKLSHMAQWESARLEAEARLVRESKLRSHSFSQGCSSSSSRLSPASAFAAPGHILTKTSRMGGDNHESPTSILTFSEGVPPTMATSNMMENPKKQTIEFVGTSDQQGGNIIKEEGEQDWKNSMPNLGEFKEEVEKNTMSHYTSTSFHDISMSISLEAPWTGHGSPVRSSPAGRGGSTENEVEDEGFTELLLNSSGEQSLSEGSGGGGGDSDSGGESGGSGRVYHEDSKSYWNSILNSVNSSPSGSPLF